jgi:hypothetical protein
MASGPAGEETIAEGGEPCESAEVNDEPRALISLTVRRLETVNLFEEEIRKSHYIAFFIFPFSTRTFASLSDIYDAPGSGSHPHR